MYVFDGSFSFKIHTLIDNRTIIHIKRTPIHKKAEKPEIQTRFVSIAELRELEMELHEMKAKLCEFYSSCLKLK